MALNTVLCVTTYNEYFIMMWWWRELGETVSCPCFRISLPNILNTLIYSDGIKIRYFRTQVSWTSSIVWYSDQHPFQKPDIFNPLVRRWNRIWTDRKKEAQSLHQWTLHHFQNILFWTLDNKLQKSSNITK